MSTETSQYTQYLIAFDQLSYCKDGKKETRYFSLSPTRKVLAFEHCMDSKLSQSGELFAFVVPHFGYALELESPLRFDNTRADAKRVLDIITRLGEYCKKVEKQYRQPVFWSEDKHGWKGYTDVERAVWWFVNKEEFKYMHNFRIVKVNMQFNIEC